MQERKHGEGQLQSEHDLAERQQIGHAAFPVKSDDQYRRRNRQRSRDQSPHPGPNAPVHEALHDDLSCQGSRDGAALSRRQQSNGKKRARKRGSQQRGQGQVSYPDPIAVGREVDQSSIRHGHTRLAKEYRRSEH